MKMKIAIAIILSLLIFDVSAKMRRSYHSRYARDDYEDDRPLRRHRASRVRYERRERNYRRVSRSLKHIRHKRYLRTVRKHISRHHKTFRRLHGSENLKRSSRKLNWQNDMYPTASNVDVVIKANYTAMFNKFKSFCANKMQSCTDNCNTDYCSKNANSMYCTRCYNNCIYVADNPCYNYNTATYNPKNDFLIRFTSDFNSNTFDRCDNYEKRYCGKTCNDQYCTLYPRSIECSACKESCTQAGLERCYNNWGIRREMTDYRNRIKHSLEKVYNTTFTDAPLLVTKSEEFCKFDCDKTYCTIDPDTYVCGECKTSCTSKAQWFRSTLKPVSANTQTYFNAFFDESHKCTRIHGEIVALCRKARCNKNDPYHQNCIECIKDGLIGAKQACVVKIRKDTYDQQVYNGVAAYFKRAPLRCETCNGQYIRGPCDNYCQQDQKCKNSCNAGPSEMACLSTCSGDKKQLYNTKFNPKMQAEFNKREETCETCQTYCDMDWLRVCYESDFTCKNEFAVLCRHECNLRFCQAFKDRHQMYSQNLSGSKELYQSEMVLALQRAKRKQVLRLEYDQKKIEKIQELALNLKRNAIFDSIKLMEGLIYEEQRDLTVKTENKELTYEEETMKKIFSAYTTAENLAKTSDPEVLIFDT